MADTTTAKTNVVSDEVINIAPTPPPQFNDIKPEDITELAKQYLITISNNIQTCDKICDRYHWGKYSLLALQFLGGLGTISGATISATTNISTYPIIGVYVFSGINMLAMFVQNRINPEQQLANYNAIKTQLTQIQWELQAAQTTKSVERFKYAESLMDSVLPSLKF